MTKKTLMKKLNTAILAALTISALGMTSVSAFDDFDFDEEIISSDYAGADVEEEIIAADELEGSFVECEVIIDGSSDWNDYESPDFSGLDDFNIFDDCEEIIEYYEDIPEETEAEEKEQAESEAQAETEEQAESEAQAETEEQTEEKEQAETEEFKTEFRFENDEVEVELKVSEDRRFPADAEIKAEKIKEGTAAYEEAKIAVMNSLGTSEQSHYSFYDVNIIVNGEEADIDDAEYIIHFKHEGQTVCIKDGIAKEIKA